MVGQILSVGWAFALLALGREGTIMVVLRMSAGRNEPGSCARTNNARPRERPHALPGPSGPSRTRHPNVGGVLARARSSVVVVRARSELLKRVALDPAPDDRDGFGRVDAIQLDIDALCGEVAKPEPATLVEGDNAGLGAIRIA